VQVWIIEEIAHELILRFTRVVAWNVNSPWWCRFVDVGGAFDDTLECECVLQLGKGVGRPGLHVPL
jgi:hypothetical protein